MFHGFTFSEKSRCPQELTQHSVPRRYVFMTAKPTLLLTGATGFLGTAICQRLSGSVHLIPHGNRSCPPGGIQADLTAEGEVERVLKETGPDVVIHTAAAREPDVCEERVDFAERLNRDLPGRLAAALPESSRLIHISTDYVFDGKTPPYSEEDKVSPLNVYGRTKAEAEPLVLAHPGGTVLRIPVLVGEGPGFIQQMLDALNADDPDPIDDVLIRHPAWTVDIAEVCAWILEERVTGIWQASSEQGGTRYELNCRVANALGLSAEHLRPSSRIVPRKAERPLNSRLSPRKLLAAGGPACRELEDVVSALSLEHVE